METFYPCELFKAPTEVQSWRNAIRERGCNKPLVLTNGCFDAPLHPGHIAVLAFAARLGYVLVAVDSDENVRELKGKGRPILPLADRIKILAGIRYVFGILPFHGPILPVIQAVHPDLYVKGMEWKGQSNGMVFLDTYACQAKFCPMDNKSEWSTSKIIARIRKLK